MASLWKLKVRNTGQKAGKEVAQLYVREQSPKVVRPEKELKAFAKVALQPGEEKMISFQLVPPRFCILRRLLA